jgi:hypothetical protein
MTLKGFFQYVIYFFKKLLSSENFQFVVCYSELSKNIENEMMSRSKMLLKLRKTFLN